MAKKYNYSSKNARVNADWIMDGILESDESDNFQPGIPDNVAAIAYVMANIIEGNENPQYNKENLTQMFLDILDSACEYYQSQD